MDTLAIIQITRRLRSPAVARAGKIKRTTIAIAQLIQEARSCESKRDIAAGAATKSPFQPGWLTATERMTIKYVLSTPGEFKVLKTRMPNGSGWPKLGGTRLM